MRMLERLKVHYFFPNKLNDVFIITSFSFLKQKKNHSIVYLINFLEKKKSSEIFFIMAGLFNNRTFEQTTHWICTL